MSQRPITEDDLHAYVDRLLEPERRTEVIAYLEAHPEVGKRVAGFVAQRDLLCNALAPIADEPLPAGLNLSRIIENQRKRPWRASWAVAAMLLLSVGGIGGWIARGSMEVPSSGLAALAQEAAYSYNVYAPDHARPVEIRASDSAQLVQWASNRLQRPVKVPDLAIAGYRLMGGRVVATSHGPAAMFMYDNDHGERLVVLTRSMSTDQGAPMKPQTSGDVAGFSWADEGIGYSLVGHSPTEALRPIADEVRRQARTI